MFIVDPDYCNPPGEYMFWDRYTVNGDLEESELLEDWISDNPGASPKEAPGSLELEEWHLAQELDVRIDQLAKRLSDIDSRGFLIRFDKHFDSDERAFELKPLAVTDLREFLFHSKQYGTWPIALYESCNHVDGHDFNFEFRSVSSGPGASRIESTLRIALSENIQYDPPYRASTRGNVEDFTALGEVFDRALRPHMNQEFYNRIDYPNLFETVYPCVDGRRDRTRRYGLLKTAYPDGQPCVLAYGADSSLPDYMDVVLELTTSNKLDNEPDYAVRPFPIPVVNSLVAMGFVDAERYAFTDEAVSKMMTDDEFAELKRSTGITFVPSHTHI